MKWDKRIYLSFFWVIAGIVLVGLAIMEKLDSFWSGMGSALLVVGILQILRHYRFNKNEAYREKMEIEYSDERNAFIRNKAWAWAGYLFVLISAVSVIVFRILGLEQWSYAAAVAVCLMLVLYWICYYTLRRKY